MKPLLLCLFGAALLSAQAAILAPVASSNIVVGGGTVTVSLNLSGIPAGGISAVQWTTNVPAGWTIAAPVTSVPGKGLSCNGPTCILWGFNVTALPAGTVATFTITAPANPGLAQVTLTNLVASDPGGAKVALTTIPVITLLGKKYDPTGDGVVSKADVQTVVDQSLGKTACTADLDGDGSCGPADVTLEILAWQLLGSIQAP